MFIQENIIKLNNILGELLIRYFTNIYLIQVIVLTISSCLCYIKLCDLAHNPNYNLSVCDFMKILPLFLTVDSSMNFVNNILSLEKEYRDGTIELFGKNILGMIFIISKGIKGKFLIKVRRNFPTGLAPQRRTVCFRWE